MIIYDLPSEDYFRLPALSQSGLKALMKSPAHYHWASRHPNENSSTPAKTQGRDLHCAILEPERFLRTYARGPNVSKSTLLWKNECANTDKILLKPDEYDLCMYINDSIQKNYSARELLGSPLDTEVTATWDYRGVPCRGRADAKLRDLGVLLDLKSAQDACKREAARSIKRYRYHWQAAWYLDGFNWAGPEREIEQFVFIFFEKLPPHGVGVYELSGEILDEGRRRREEGLDLYLACKETGVWPAYSEYLEMIEVLE